MTLEVYTLDARYHSKAYRFIILSIDNLFHAYVSFSEMCTGWENLEQWQRLTVANCSNIWKSDQQFCFSGIWVMKNMPDWLVKKHELPPPYSPIKFWNFSFWHCHLFVLYTLPSKTITNRASMEWQITEFRVISNTMNINPWLNLCCFTYWRV